MLALNRKEVLTTYNPAIRVSVYDELLAAGIKYEVFTDSNGLANPNDCYHVFVHRKDYDKAKETGLQAVQTGESVAFKQATTVILCKKIAFQDLDPSGFIDSDIIKNCYPDNDFHRMYVGEIVRVLKAD